MVRSGWLIVLACIIYTIAQLVFSLPGYYFFRKLVKGTLDQDYLMDIGDYPWIELSMNGGGVAGALIGCLLVWKLINKRDVGAFGLQINRLHMKDFGFGLLLGGASMTVIFIVLALTGYVQMNSSLTAPDFSVYSLTFLILFLLVGFSEEIFFRGYLMVTMKDRHNPKWLIYIISALIFSLFHGMNPNVSILGMLNIAIVGLLFSFMYDATKSLWMPVGYHITWNYFQGNVFGFPVSGTNPHGLYQITLENGYAVFTGGGFGPEGGLLATVMVIIGVFITKLYCSRRFS